MEEPNTYDHQHEHPLILLKEKAKHPINNLLTRFCWRCEQEVSPPYFVCAEDCWFYLHKVCAMAPLELDHPFHPHHPLLLTPHPPSASSPKVWRLCDFCQQPCLGFVYHCSCDLVFHIKCALLTFSIAQNDSKELEHVPLEDASISTTSVAYLFDWCFACGEPLRKYTYLSPECGLKLHKKCVQLSLKLNHACHRKHPLVLQFNTEQLSCKICLKTSGSRFVYACLSCEFVIHISCLSQPPNIEHESHPHPFTLLLRQVPFVCDACGIEGGHVAYTCVTCNIIIHRECISLPRVIKSKWHDHRLFHTYFLHREDTGILDCLICHEEVNTEHGSYSCSKCNDLFHVNCATKDKGSYYIVENEDEEPLDMSVNSIVVLEWNDAGDAVLVEHFKHIHSLRLSDKVSEYDIHKFCDGCLLPISTSFYYCSLCEFYLHKVCAELPKVKHVWHHRCQQPLVLTSDKVFRCVKCNHASNAFAYKCEECDHYTCLRCVLALTPGARTCQGHKHPLRFYTSYCGQCTACGDQVRGGMFRCRDCNISLDLKCFSLPITVQHKCDKHLLLLTDHDDKSYSENHFCDICEESRAPNLWFYHCARCNTSAHVKCVLGKFSFVKLGSIIEDEEDDSHEHPLTFVKKMYYYPDCSGCGKPCLNFALECTRFGCSFICHVSCNHVHDNNFTCKACCVLLYRPYFLFEV